MVSRCEKPEACQVVSVCAQQGRIPCVDVVSFHGEKLRLCDALEAVADSLPARVDLLKCLRIANELVPLLRESHRYEEEYVFPVFERGAAGVAGRLSSIRRLKAEHVEDECAAQDITDALFSIGHGAPVENPEALGFMLRSFFETLRRHIAFERDHVLPAVVAASSPE
ncbi:hemerythrin domain-containing protein [soil metagenome]